MITFFRRIRQNLIKENKIGRYILYAVGEILLVVIGILIALQINNWNDNQRQEEIIIKYYNQILVDFDKEKDYLNGLNQFNDSSIQSYEKAQKIYEKPDLTIQDILSSLSQVVYQSQYLKFNTNTIETLETTGDIKLLEPIIRDKLITLKRNQENTIDVASGNNEIFLNSFMKAIQSGWNLQTIKLRNHRELKELFESRNNPVEIINLVETAYGLKNFTERELRNDFKSMLNDIFEIEKLIKIELERNE